MADDTTTSPTESLEYRAEVKQLLDILAHSLYTDREVFLRLAGRRALAVAEVGEVELHRSEALGRRHPGAVHEVHVVGQALAQAPDRAGAFR